MSDRMVHSTDVFVFKAAPGAESGGGLEEMIWIDLDPPVSIAESHRGTVLTAGNASSAADEPDPQPVLMVVADQQDFWY